MYALRSAIFLGLLAGALCYSRQLTCKDTKWKTEGVTWDMGTTTRDTKEVNLKRAGVALACSSTIQAGEELTHNFEAPAGYGFVVEAEGCMFKQDSITASNADQTVKSCDPQTRTGVATSTLICYSAGEITVRAGWDDNQGGKFMLSKDCKYTVNGNVAPPPTAVASASISSFSPLITAFAVIFPLLAFWH